MRLGEILRHLTQSSLLVQVALFQDILSQYSSRYQTLLGSKQLRNEQGGEIYALLTKWELYVENDGSEKDGTGTHAYRFTNARKTGKVWGGAALTPGNVDEMASLRAELGGAIEGILVIYVLQAQQWSSSHPITI